MAAPFDSDRNAVQVLPDLLADIAASAIVASLVSGFLLFKSVKDFSRTGPQLQKEILANYRLYAVFALFRLGVWAFLICLSLALCGVFLLEMGALAMDGEPSFTARIAAGTVALVLIAGLRFSWILQQSPATIVASSQYNLARFRPLQRLLPASRLRTITAGLAAGALVVTGLAMRALATQGRWSEAIGVAMISGGAVAIWWLAVRDREPDAVQARRRSDKRPNILMIGSDTLRADRLGANGYYRSLTPRIDALARRGSLFTHCFVPCARTAPSLLSAMSGCWPHRHGIRDNYVADDEGHLDVPLLPQILRQAGYSTAVVGDWAASDFAKFDLGFDRVLTPPDQWNIKYLMRQGPKDLRLFLSLFVANRLGRAVLPEIYYLAGVPRTAQVGMMARREINRLASTDQPFLLTVFAASTHPPFGSENPYFRMFSDPNYRGDSLYAMSRLTDPFEVIRRQGQAREEFDLDQIEDLYDGCVRSFDDEVAKTLSHLDACGISDDTIVVVFSDHGMEFFEQDTWGQGNSVFGDQSAQTPMLIFDPRTPTGRTHRQIVRSIDLAPTLLELATGATVAGTDGVSLARSVRTGAAPPPLIARNETGIWLTAVPGMPPGHIHYPELPDLLYVPDKRSGTLAVRPEYRTKVVQAKDRMVRSAEWKVTFQPMESGSIVRIFSVTNGCLQEATGGLAASAPPELRADLEHWLAEDYAEQ